jgi:hypothetical protein
MLAVFASILTPRRIVHYSVMIVIVFHLGFIASMVAGEFPFDAFGQPFAVDFTAKVTGGRLALDGELARLYQIDVQKEVQQQLLDERDPSFLNLFIAPAAVSWLYAPFAAIPYFPAALLWIAASLGFFVGALRVLWPLIPGLHAVGFRRVMLVAFSALPVIECLQTGQDSLLSLLMIALAIRWLLEGNELAAGTVIGLGMYKPQLFILFPFVLLAQRRWRALIAFGATASALAGISLALTGLSGIGQYARLLRSDEYVLGIAQAGAWHMISLPAVVRSVIPVEARPFVEGAFLACGAAVTYVLSRRSNRKSTASQQRDMRVLASTILITALSIPHIFTYDGAILLVPALVLLSEGFSDRRIRSAVAVLYLSLFAVLPVHVIAAKLPAPMRVIDSQWAVLAIAGLLWLAWHPGAVDLPTSPLSPRPELASSSRICDMRAVSSAPS